MLETVSSILGAWSNFYTTTGSAAATLTGLMFVVITIVRRGERPLNQTQAQNGISTFSTPTVMHFAAALFFSLFLTTPWHSFVPAAIVLGSAGLYGVIYMVRIAYRTRSLILYTADAEDWMWYTILPLVAYVIVAVGAGFLLIAPARALFALATAEVLLILIGVRNAWDIVTYIASRAADAPPPPTA